MLYIGIDPGKSGGIAILCDAGPNAITTKLDLTEADVFHWLTENTSGDQFALIEKVSSSPQMGVVSAFSFGRSYGFLRGLLAALRIPYDEVAPGVWQRAMGCLSGGDKNVTKAKAQQLFPDMKVTHANADALLIATYCKRTHSPLLV